MTGPRFCPKSRHLRVPPEPLRPEADLLCGVRIPKAHSASSPTAQRFSPISVLRNADPLIHSKSANG
jgi:hypothetical protein